ncbi:helix-turn-helix transcriptional regulator, partial [Novosphingobium sp. 1949]
LSGLDPGPADLWLRHPGGYLLIDVRPLPLPPWQLGLGARAILTLRPLLAHAGQSPQAIDTASAEAMGAKLATALDLTLTEGVVTALIAHGLSRRDIAILRSVSPQTVNSQLRTIFVKCAVNRESELAAIARAILEAVQR